MAYCTLDDVRTINAKRVYDANSKPTSTQVEDMITDIAAELDSILSGRGLEVPVTTPEHFVKFLKQTNAIGAGAFAEFSAFPEAEKSAGGTTHGTTLRTEYRARIVYLRDGDLPTSASSPIPRSFFTERGEEPEPRSWGGTSFAKSRSFDVCPRV